MMRSNIINRESDLDKLFDTIYYWFLMENLCYVKHGDSEHGRKVASKVGLMPDLIMWSAWRDWAIYTNKPSENIKFLVENGWIDNWKELEVLSMEDDLLEETYDLVDWVHSNKKDNYDEPMYLSYMFSALLWNIGRANTIKRKNGNVTYTNCSYSAKQLSRKFLLSIGAPNYLINIVPDIVSNSEWDLSANRKKIKSIMNDLNSEVSLLIMLINLIKHSKRKHRINTMANIKNVIYNIHITKPLLSGKDLLGLGFKEGPLIGKIMNRLSSEQKAGVIYTKEQALKFVGENWNVIKT